MTNTKILEKVTAIEATKDEVTRQSMLEEFLAELRTEIATEMNKKAGKGNQSKIIKKLLRENEKNKVPENFCRTYILDGRQYVATPHRVIRFANPSTDVDTKEWEPGDLDFRRLIPTTYTSELSVPDIGKLKIYLKEQKAIRKAVGENTKEGVSYCIDGKVIVNIEFLIDALEAIPSIELFTVNESPISPIIGKDDKGNCCFILPLRPKEYKGSNTGEENRNAAQKHFTELLTKQAKYGL